MADRKNPNAAAAALVSILLAVAPAAGAAGRSAMTLTENWHVKQLDDTPTVGRSVPCASNGRSTMSMASTHRTTHPSTRC